MRSSPDRTLTIACLVVLALAGAAHATPPAGDESLIRGLLDEQARAWNRGDLEGYMKGYWRSPELSFFGGGERAQGYDETLARYRRRYKAEGRAMGTLAFTELTIELVSPDAAIARGAWHLVLPDGKKPEGLFTLLLRRKPEGWRIVHDHSSAADATPAVRVSVRNTTTAGGVEIVAQTAVELDPRLMVERLTDGRWAPVAYLDLGSMRLVERCDQQLGTCVSLDAGRTLKPVPWSGMSCSSQCNGTCDKNFRMSGTYRFVVKTCDAKERFEGPPFTFK